MSKVVVNDSSLTAIGNAIRNKTGESDKLSLAQMPTAIESIQGGGEGGGSLSDYIPDEALNITGSCGYSFYVGRWNWFINKYGSRIRTSNISTSLYMFSGCRSLTEIPFALNFASNITAMQYTFENCNDLITTPEINFENNVITGTPTWAYMFNGCYKIREIPEGIVNVDISSKNNSASQFGYGMFLYCYSLRRIPPEFTSKLWNKATTYSSAPYNNLFNCCTSLDEVINLGVPKGTISSAGSVFSNIVNCCYRLKRFTFKTNEDGSAQTANFKAAILDMSTCGFFNYSTPSWNEFSIQSGIDASNIVKYNSGITADKCIYDTETYEALKDDPDSFYMTRSSNKGVYSRYNKLSAIETIASLPDTSAYGTNTIKFAGTAGSATDGGAINTMTADEIAVATSKGWTVSFV